MKPMWTLTVQGGPEKVNHASVLIGNLMYVFGGFSNQENFDILNPIDIHIFNTKLLKWKKLQHSDELDNDFILGKVPFMRFGHCVVLQKPSTFYLWGGRNNLHGSCSTLFQFCIRDMSWDKVSTNGTTPTPRDGHTMSLVKNNVFVFGGWDAVSNSLSCDLYQLNLCSFTWSRIITNTSIPNGRDYHTATVLDDFIIICGGRTSDPRNYLQVSQQDLDVWVFNCKETTWHQKSSPNLNIPLARRSHTAFIHCHHLYVFAGYGTHKRHHFNDLWKFCLKTQKWSEIKSFGILPSPCRRQSCCVGNHNKVYFFGGTTPSIKNLEHDDLLKDMSTVHVLDFEPSLKTICLQKIINHKICTKQLPSIIREEINFSRPPE